MVELTGGPFRMGSTGDSAYPADGEGPVHEVELGAFRIDTCAVTNARFSEFVDATGFVTEAQRFGWSFVFAGLLPDDFPDTRSVASAPWWRQVHGADWDSPGRSALGPRRTFRSPGRPRVVVGRPGVLHVERNPLAERGGMGVRRGRWPGVLGVPVG